MVNLLFDFVILFVCDLEVVVCYVVNFEWLIVEVYFIDVIRVDVNSLILVVLDLLLMFEFIGVVGGVYVGDCGNVWVSGVVMVVFDVFVLYVDVGVV